MGKIKDFISVGVGAVLGGVTMGQVGSNMTGAVSGIGRATQTLIGGGVLSHAAKLVKWK